MTRENIISLALKHGWMSFPNLVFAPPALEAFYHAAQAEALKDAAKLCEQAVTHPPGYGGQWEGYGSVTTQRNGKGCAAAIREMAKEMK